jgi:hypothetical protein
MEQARKYYRWFERMLYVFFLLWVAMLLVPHSIFKYVELGTTIAKNLMLMSLAVSLLCYYESKIFPKNEKSSDE